MSKKFEEENNFIGAIDALIKKQPFDGKGYEISGGRSEAKVEFNYAIHHLGNNIVKRAVEVAKYSGRNTITTKNVEFAVAIDYPTIHKQIQKAGMKAVTASNKPVKSRTSEKTSGTKRAGLHLQVPRVERIIRRQTGKRYQVKKDAIVYMAGALEHLAKMIITAVAIELERMKKKQFESRAFTLAIKRSPALSRAFAGVQLTGGVEEDDYQMMRRRRSSRKSTRKSSPKSSRRSSSKKTKGKKSAAKSTRAKKSKAKKSAAKSKSTRGKTSKSKASKSKAGKGKTSKSKASKGKTSKSKASKSKTSKGKGKSARGRRSPRSPRRSK